MQKTIYSIFLIITLLSSSFAEKNFNPFFKDLRKTDYGNEIASTIQVELETQGNIQIVVDMVYSIRDAVREEKQAKDQEHDAENDRCLENRAELMGMINTASNNQQKHQLSLKIDKPLLQFRIEEKGRKTKEKTEREDMVRKLQAERKTEKDAFDQMNKEHEMVRMMIEQARQIMRTLLDDTEEGNFLQVSTSKVADTFKAFGKKLSSFKVKENTPSGHYNTVFLLLIKMAERAPANADEYLVQNILNILDRLQENLESSLSIEKAAEKTRAQDFEEIMARLDELSRNLPTQLQALDTDIRSIGQRIENANDQIAAQQQTMDDNQKLLDNMNAECYEIEKQYEIYNAFVTEQLRVLRNALYLLEDRRDELQRLCAQDSTLP